VKSLFLVGPPGSGKTAVALGLALKFRKEGKYAGYFKPIGYVQSAGAKSDADGVLMEQVLGLKEGIEAIVPHTLSSFYLLARDDAEVIRKRILEAYKLMISVYDPVIIDGASLPWAAASYGLDSISLAREIGAEVLCTINVQHDYDFDEALFLMRYAAAKGVGVAGCIFNKVQRPLLAKAEGVYANILKASGFRYLGAIPRRSEIHAPTVAEFHEVLGGEILTGQQNLNLLVEDVLIGAMTIESALDTLRRSLNKAVIIGGDRADYALSALETSTSVLILTGGLYPSISVITKATEKGVPVILVHYDTYTTIEKISEVARRIRPNDEKAIKLAVENIEQFCNWKLILEALAG